jgi:inorganic pyrophosphatase/exopolyphosphatase
LQSINDLKAAPVLAFNLPVGSQQTISFPIISEKNAMHPSTIAATLMIATFICASNVFAQLESTPVAPENDYRNPIAGPEELLAV